MSSISAPVASTSLHLPSQTRPLGDDDYRSSDYESDSDSESNDSEAKCVRVQRCNPVAKSGKRNWAKQHACLFCQKQISKMARHLQSCHLSEKEIRPIMSLDKKSKERRRMFDNLTRMGDFYSNLKVLETGTGELQVLRRPTAQTDYVQVAEPKEYTPCPGCLGFVVKRDLWRHAKRCQDMRNCDGKTVQSDSNLLLFQILTDVPEQFKVEILSTMKQDEVFAVLRNDELIINLGMSMFDQYGSTQSRLISQHMRMMATLLIEVRRVANNADLTLLQCISPERFDDIVAAVQQRCRLLITKGSRPQLDNAPSFGLKVGHDLHKCAQLVRNQALKTRNAELLADADAFASIHKFEWPRKISSHALSTLNHRKQNKIDLLPCTEDLVTLVKHQKQKIAQLSSQMESYPERSTWHHLAELVLSRIIVFNKRRSGEVGRMKLTQYVDRTKWQASVSTDFQAVLSPLEKQLCQRLDLIKVPGKRDIKYVPMLLTEDIVNALDCLVKHRALAGIDNSNPYLFANNFSKTGKCMRGHDAVRKVAVDAKLKNVTSTKLRKYMATVSQIFELTEGEVDWLARHLGHDIRVHREYYRLHDSSIELAKISKLLLEVENGNAEQWKGKKLEDISLDYLMNDNDDIDSDDPSDVEDFDVEDLNISVAESDPNISGGNYYVAF